MDFLQNIDLSIVVPLALMCVSALVVLFVVSMFLNILSSGLGLVAGVFNLIFGVLGGGPESWCGCLVVFFGCGICSALALVTINFISTCGTANQVNFCRLLGY